LRNAPQKKIYRKILLVSHPVPGNSGYPVNADRPRSFFPDSGASAPPHRALRLAAGAVRPLTCPIVQRPAAFLSVLSQLASIRWWFIRAGKGIAELCSWNSTPPVRQGAGCRVSGLAAATPP